MPIIRLFLAILFLGFVLSMKGLFVTQSDSIGVWQIQGVAAQEFMINTGIMEQITEDLPTVPPTGERLEYPTTSDDINDVHKLYKTDVQESVPWIQQSIIVSNDCAQAYLFGADIALDGDTIVIGTIGSEGVQGATYIFTRNGTTWSLQQKLANEEEFNFGFSVAIDGDTAVIGTLNAAYIFTRSGTTWNQQQKLVANDGAVYDYFGYSVALDGDTAVIGASRVDVGDNGAQGAAYIFTYNGTMWNQQQKLVANDGAAHDFFGSSVTLDGDTAIIGAPNPYDDDLQDRKGGAYVFTRNGTTWNLQQKLVANDGLYNFGSSVALDGDTAVIGAHGRVGDYEKGAAYVFTRNSTTWSLQQKLIGEDEAVDNLFGMSVAVDGDTAVIGAPHVKVGNNIAQGAAYIFTRNSTTWNQQQKLVANDGAVYDYFGSVSIEGGTIFVGAPWANEYTGRVYLFERKTLLTQRLFLPIIVR